MRDRVAEQWWQEHGVNPEVKRHECDFCGHPYLKPCTEEQHVNCANWLKKPKPVVEPEESTPRRRKIRRK